MPDGLCRLLDIHLCRPSDGNDAGAYAHRVPGPGVGFLCLRRYALSGRRGGCPVLSGLLPPSVPGGRGRQRQRVAPGGSPGRRFIRAKREMCGELSRCAVRKSHIAGGDRGEYVRNKSRAVPENRPAGRPVRIRRVRADGIRLFGRTVFGTGGYRGYFLVQCTGTFPGRIFRRPSGNHPAVRHRQPAFHRQCAYAFRIVQCRR